MKHGEAASATARPSPCEAPSGAKGEARQREDRRNIPEFSPRMLRLFLRARVEHAAAGSHGGSRMDKLIAGKRRIRDAAGVTNFEFDMAWMGRLGSATPRLKLWGALGHIPADHGLMLTDDGGQERAEVPS